MRGDVRSRHDNTLVAAHVAGFPQEKKLDRKALEGEGKNLVLLDWVLRLRSASSWSSSGKDNSVSSILCDKNMTSI